MQSTDILRLSESFILLAFLGLLKNCTVENGHYKRGGRTLYKGGRTLKLGETDLIMVPQFLGGVEIFFNCVAISNSRMNMFFYHFFSHKF